MKKIVILLLLLEVFLPGYAGPAHVDSVQIRTKAPANRIVTVHFRVPKDYDPKRIEQYRVLVLFGGRNTDGKADVTGRLGWGEWADQLGIFLACPGFKDDNYWEPREWSGKALLSALAEIRKRYHICTGQLLFYGYSAGSQCANLFPAWKPDLACAWVAHACGVFHEPDGRMRKIPGLVTCGDADVTRYLISRNFVGKARKLGTPVIWKSYPNSPHDVPPDSLRLARAFLAYYHEQNRKDLDLQYRLPSIVEKSFIGDDLDETYYPAESVKAGTILPEDRVFLPNRSIAEAWGKPAK